MVLQSLDSMSIIAYIVVSISIYYIKMFVFHFPNLLSMLYIMDCLKVATFKLWNCVLLKILNK